MLRSVPLGKYWRSRSVSVLVGAGLPGDVRIAEIDPHARIDLEARVLGHLSSLIPSQRPAQLLRQGDDRARNGITYGLGAMTGEWGPVLHASLVAMARHAWQVQQKSEARRALHQGTDRRTPKTQDEVSFPVARHDAINCHRRTLVDHDLGREEGLASPARARPRHPQGSCRWTA